MLKSIRLCNRPKGGRCEQEVGMSVLLMERDFLDSPAVSDGQEPTTATAAADWMINELSGADRPADSPRLPTGVLLSLACVDRALHNPSAACPGCTRAHVVSLIVC